MFIEFINEYGTTIIYTLLTAFAGYLGLWIKSLYTKYINDKTKKDVVRTCVRAVEQLYKDLHGEEKYNEVVVSASGKQRKSCEQGKYKYQSFFHFLNSFRDDFALR